MTLRVAVLLLALSGPASFAVAAENAPAPSTPPAGARIYTLADFPADAPQTAPYLDGGTQTGTATVSCETGDNERFTRCFVVKDMPAGSGFAEAAMKTLLTKGVWGGTPGQWVARSFEYRPPNPDLRYYTLADFPNLPETPNDQTLYPERARAEEIEGMASIECIAGEAGRYESCAFLREGPKGYGFGEATVALFLSTMRTMSPRGAVQRMNMKWAF